MSMWFSLVVVVVDVYEILPHMEEMKCLDMPMLVIPRSGWWVLHIAFNFVLKDKRDGILGVLQEERKRARNWIGERDFKNPIN
jgi:hypothetical protein